MEGFFGKNIYAHHHVVEVYTNTPLTVKFDSEWACSCSEDERIFDNGYYKIIEVKEDDTMGGVKAQINDLFDYISNKEDIYCRDYKTAIDIAESIECKYGKYLEGNDIHTNMYYVPDVIAQGNVVVFVITAPYYVDNVYGCKKHYTYDNMSCLYYKHYIIGEANGQQIDAEKVNDDVKQIMSDFLSMHGQYKIEHKNGIRIAANIFDRIQNRCIATTIKDAFMCLGGHIISIHCYVPSNAVSMFPSELECKCSVAPYCTLLSKHIEISENDTEDDAYSRVVSFVDNMKNIMDTYYNITIKNERDMARAVADYANDKKRSMFSQGRISDMYLPQYIAHVYGNIVSIEITTLGDTQLNYPKLCMAGDGRWWYSTPVTDLQSAKKEIDLLYEYLGNLNLEYNKAHRHGIELVSELFKELHPGVE